VVQFDSKMYS